MNLIVMLQIPGWNPVTIVKGGPAANALCRGLDSEWGRKLVGKTLIRNIAQSIYQNRRNLEKGVRQVTLILKGLLCRILHKAWQRHAPFFFAQVSFIGGNKDQSTHADPFLCLQAPGMKNVSEFSYAFKIRDKKNPKDWYLSEDLTILPAEKDIGVSFLEKVRIRLTGK